MTNKEGIIWFLDCDDDSSAFDGTATQGGVSQRPWQAYWPPKSESQRDLWLRSEHPEVLWWRFDLMHPYDRPWRGWAVSAHPRPESSHVTTMQPQENSQKNSRDIDILASKSISVFNRLTLLNQEQDQIFNRDLTKLPRSGSMRHLLNYLAPIELYSRQKPYHSRLPSISGTETTNIFTESYPVTIEDVSGQEDLFTLEESGLQFLKLPTEITCWTDSVVVSEYIPAISKWLKEYFQCEMALVYTYNFRGEQSTGVESNAFRTPFFRAHCDATSRSCAKRLQLYFPDNAEAIMTRRYRHINVWRAITGPEQNCPLALCDFRSVSNADLVPVDAIYPHFCDEGYELKHNPNHRWVYKKGMSKDDVIIFKLDDNSDTEAKFCPHSAFVDPTVSSDYARISIEVKAIVIG